MSGPRAGHAAVMAGVLPTLAAAIRQAEAAQRAELLAGRGVLPVEVRVIVDTLIRPAADALVVAFAALYHARRKALGDAERGQRLGYCLGLIDAAAQRRELEHGEFAVLSGYAVRLAAEGGQ